MIQRRSAGYSVMELVVVMGVIGAALATAMIYQGRVSSQNKVNSFCAAIQDTVDKVRAAYASNPNGFNGIRANDIGNMKLYSPPIRFDGTNLMTPFTSNGILVDGNVAEFWMQFEVSQEECVMVGTKLGAIANSAYAPPYWTEFQNSGNWNLTNLNNGCRAVNPPQLLFYFGRY